MATCAIKSDAEIQQDVIRELKWDSRVDETDVGVEVDGGIVTLTGRVSSWAKKLAAAEAAHRVFGVLDVANDVHVQVTGEHSDTDIAKAVRNALRWDVLVPEEKIASTVENGIITLTGTVGTVAQREDAVRAVRNLAGVRAVSDRITVVPVKVAPADVKRAIEEALERQAVAGAARGLPGVQKVDVRLRVTSLL